MGISVSTLRTRAIGGVGPEKDDDVVVGAGSGAGLSLSAFLCLGDGAAMLCAGCTGDATTSSLAASASLLSLPFPFSLIGVSVFPCFFLSSNNNNNHINQRILKRKDK